MLQLSSLRKILNDESILVLDAARLKRDVEVPANIEKTSGAEAALVYRVDNKLRREEGRHSKFVT